MKYVIVIGLVAVSLVACNKPATRGGGGAGGEAPFRGGEAVASPQRKAGLWQQTVQTERGRTIVSQACFDDSSDRLQPVLPRQPRRAGVCARFNVAKSGDGYVIDTDCSRGGAGGPRVTDHAVVSGDFSSKYTIVNNVNIQNAANAARNGQHTLTLTATYQGACPADILPGQTKLASGEVIDSTQVRQSWGGVPMGVARPAGARQGRWAGATNATAGTGPNRRNGAGQGGRRAQAGAGDAGDDDGGQ